MQAAVGVATGTAIVTYSGQAEWNSSTNGIWNSSVSWTNTSTETATAPPGMRGFAGDTVLFDSATGNIARLDGADPSLAAISFNNATIGYTIAQGSGGSLTLRGGGASSGSATVSVLAGNHAISAPVHLAANTVFSAAPASSLTVTGAVDGTGSLTINGGGQVYLSGSNHYSGDSSVAGGTLIITNVAALPDRGNIVVGSSSLFASAIAPVGQSVSPVVSSPAGAASSAAPIFAASAALPTATPAQMIATAETPHSASTFAILAVRNCQVLERAAAEPEFDPP